MNKGLDLASIKVLVGTDYLHLHLSRKSSTSTYIPELIDIIERERTDTTLNVKTGFAS